jgi:hypothetical protein
MWGINHLIQTNFQDFGSKETIEIRELYNNNPDLYLYNPDTMIAFLHDHKYSNNDRIRNIPAETYKKVRDDYIRRISRWNSLLASGSKLLFFRLARIETNRIQYKAMLKKPSEKVALETFSETMKQRGIHFRIIYFTYDYPQSYDSSTQIIYIHIPSEMKSTKSIIDTLLSDIDVFRHVKENV